MKSKKRNLSICVSWHPDTWTKRVHHSSSTEPSFVPVAAPKGSGLDSFTVGWSQPEDEEASELVGRYHLFLQEPESGDTQELFLPKPAVDHMFTNLKPSTEYTFKVMLHCYTYLVTWILVLLIGQEWMERIIYLFHINLLLILAFIMTPIYPTISYHI